MRIRIIINWKISQILLTSIQRNAQKLEGRITKQIFGVKELRDKKILSFGPRDVNGVVVLEFLIQNWVHLLNTKTFPKKG